MSVEDEAKGILEKLGLEWPDGDPDKLREAARAWRAFASDVDEVRGATNKAAQSLIGHNRGEAVETFETFWARYVGKGDKGWLRDLPEAARSMAKALEELADEVDAAVKKLWTELSVNATVIVAGAAAAWFTAGVSAGASAAAARAVLALGARLGVTISARAASIVAGTLVGGAFGGVESVALELAVAQPIRIARGEQDGLSLADVNNAAKNGSLYGGVFGGAAGAMGGRGSVANSPALDTDLSGWMSKLPDVRGNLVPGPRGPRNSGRCVPTRWMWPPAMCC